jgi:2-keto-4-pentenoate hydratase/2-oxohepta-3-ene-1,7-dioic acid hydratase in catechol pathway
LSTIIPDLAGDSLLPEAIDKLRNCDFSLLPRIADRPSIADTFGPIGPWLVTPDEVPDPQNLDLWLEVDGHRYQNGSTRTVVFRVAYLISFLSRFMSLKTGDIISTGTLPGVGFRQKPPVFPRSGNRIRLGISGLSH